MLRISVTVMLSSGIVLLGIELVASVTYATALQLTQTGLTWNSTALRTNAAAFSLTRNVGAGNLEQDFKRQRNVSGDLHLKLMTVMDLYPDMDEFNSNFALRMPVMRRQRHNQCGILWFYHIPKSGGTAVGEWLDRMHTSGYLDAVLPLMSMTQLVDFDSFKEYNLDPILNDPAGRLVAVHHHHRGPALDGFRGTFKDMQAKLQASGCDLIRVTFLREPLAREISALYFNMDEGEFEDALTDVKRAEFHNGEVRYILNNKMNEYDLEPFPFGDTVDKATWHTALTKAEDILGEFDYVGTTEALTEGIAKILELIKTPDAADAVPLQEVNVNEHHELSDPELLEMAEEATAIDKKLYAKFS